ncbi:MAG: purine-nucleoside phosphorylase [Burkholderiales bacterium]|nr:purine-nucleoside phosphorylase [Burkholderiales bacterium]
MNTKPSPDAATAAVEATAARLRATGRRPAIAVLLGSGWGPFADAVQDPLAIPYEELPAFPVLQVGGHAGRVVLGRLGRHEVAVLAGRKHAYETGTADGMKAAVRSLARAGVQVLVQTNAAGSLTLALPPGSTMLIADHLNLAQQSPLFGEPGDERFVSMVNAYDAALREGARAALRGLQGQEPGLDAIGEGVYAWFMGPQFETPAEIRMMQLLGAQAVGMSTVPETIVARHAGLRVLAVSLLTNMAAGLSDEKLSHAHTLATAAAASARAVAQLTAIVRGMSL